MANGGMTTLQDIVSDYKQQDNFTGIGAGVKQGADIGSNLVQRQLELQKMNQEMQFKAQELDLHKHEAIGKLTDNLIKTDNPTARKFIGDQLLKTAKGFGVNISPDLVNGISRDDEFRQQVQLAAGNIDPNDPQYNYKIGRMMPMFSGDLGKTAELIKGFAEKNLDQKSKELGLIAASAAKGGLTSAQQASAAVPNNPQLASSLLYESQGAEAKNKADLAKTGAETAETKLKTEQMPERLAVEEKKLGIEMSKEKRQQYKQVLDDISSKPDIKPLLETASQVQKYAGLLHNGMNELEVAAWSSGMNRAITNARAQAGGNKFLLSTLNTQQAAISRYVSGRAGQPWNDDAVAQAKDLSDKVYQAANKVVAQGTKKYVDAAVATKVLDPQVGKAWVRASLPGADYDYEENSKKNEELRNGAPSAPPSSAGKSWRPQYQATPGQQQNAQVDDQQNQNQKKAMGLARQSWGLMKDPKKKQYIAQLYQDKFGEPITGSK